MATDRQVSSRWIADEYSKTSPSKPGRMSETSRLSSFSHNFGWVVCSEYSTVCTTAEELSEWTKSDDRGIQCMRNDIHVKGSTLITR